MLSFYPEHRPSAEGIKTHLFFSGVDFGMVENGKWDEGTHLNGNPYLDLTAPSLADSWRPSPPSFPLFGSERGATLKFTSFHNGLDSTMAPSDREVDEEFQLIPTPWVAKNRALDTKDPLVYEFTARP